MPLTEDQEKRLVNWVYEHKAYASCPACGTNDWSTGEIIAAPPHTGEARINGGETIPMIQVICDNCKFVMLFAAAPIFGKDM